MTNGRQGRAEEEHSQEWLYDPPG